MLHLITFNGTHTHTHTHTLSRTPLDEGSASHKYIHLTTHNIHSRRTSMTTAGFELAIPAVKRPQTYAIDPEAIRIAKFIFRVVNLVNWEIIN